LQFSEAVSTIISQTTAQLPGIDERS